jgi:hypothetical protein
LSDDLRTVTVSGFPITPDTRLTVLLAGAKSQAGDFLDRPYVITFSTGSSLPTGSFSGQVNFSGSDPADALVALFERSFFEGDPVAVGVVNSPYTVNYVPDGVYYPMALKDTNGDGLDPGSGDAVGFYDANGDFQPDPIVFSGGNSISNVNINLFQPSPQTALNNFDVVETAALDWSDDAELVFVNGRLDAETGESFNWFYGFYSVTLGQFNGFMLFDDVVLSAALKDDETPDTSAIRVDWMDSDEALQAALANGGSDFLSENPDAEAYASLASSSNAGYSQVARVDKAAWLEKRPAIRQIPAFRNGSEQAMWFVSFYDPATYDGFSVAIDAVTGEPVIWGLSTATQNSGVAWSAAMNWANDAQLINIQTWDLNANGFAFVWRFGFYSGSKDSVRKIDVGYGEILDEFNEPKNNQPSLETIAQNWMDSPLAAAVAEQNSNSFRGQYPDAFVDVFLSRQPMFDNRAIWRFHYSSMSGQQSLEVYVDALTGEIATGVEDGSASAPTVFELEQNYPNPFNPSTTIHYEVPEREHLVLKVYDLGGREVATLVDEVKTAGRYDVAFDAGKLASGVYFYKLTAGSFNQTRRMVLVR